MSVLVLKSRGINDVVASFGASVSKEQLILLRRFDNVSVFFDGDSAGQNGCNVILDGLKDYTRVRAITTPDGEDPASLDFIPESLGYLEYSFGYYKKR
jgi:DNA primase